MASSLGDDRDKIITFNKGAGLLTKPVKHNETAYRVNGDIVSSLSSYDHNQKTFDNISFWAYHVIIKNNHLMKI